VRIRRVAKKGDKHIFTIERNVRGPSELGSLLGHESVATLKSEGHVGLELSDASGHGVAALLVHSYGCDSLQQLDKGITEVAKGGEGSRIEGSRVDGRDERIVFRVLGLFCCWEVVMDRDAIQDPGSRERMNNGDVREEGVDREKREGGIWFLAGAVLEKGARFRRAVHTQTTRGGEESMENHVMTVCDWAPAKTDAGEVVIEVCTVQIYLLADRTENVKGKGGDRQTQAKADVELPVGVRESGVLAEREGGADDGGSLVETKGCESHVISMIIAASTRERCHQLLVGEGVEGDRADLLEMERNRIVLEVLPGVFPTGREDEVKSKSGRLIERRDCAMAAVDRVQVMVFFEIWEEGCEAIHEDGEEVRERLVNVKPSEFEDITDVRDGEAEAAERGRSSYGCLTGQAETTNTARERDLNRGRTAVW
jgi:hypothetical protein